MYAFDLRVVRRLRPELLPWACAALQHEYAVFLMEAGRVVGIVANDNGVQQGDPAGPFFYALAMLELQSALQDQMGEVVLGMPSGSALQALLAEYLNELLERTRVIVAELA